MVGAGATKQPEPKTTMTRKNDKQDTPDLKALMVQNRDLMQPLMQWLLQEVLEQEMTDSLGAAKGERCEARQGYRSGYYPRRLVTRVGTMELRVPQDRQGRFSTQLFERYQRAEKALVAALVEMSVQGRFDPQDQDDHRGTLRP